MEFLSSIYSITQAKLLITSYNISLNQHLISITNTIIEAAKSISSTTTVAVTTAVTSTSIMNGSLTSLWNFLSSIQLILFIYLLNLPFTSKIQGLILGLRKYNSFPNFFDYMGVYTGNKHQFSKAYDLGFSKNSILLNIGSIFSLFISFVGLYIIAQFLYRLTSCKRIEKNKIRGYIKEFCDNYKYNFYIRFWIQAYIEFLVAVYITIYSSTLQDLKQAYNFFLSLIFMLIIVLTIPICYLFCLSQKDKIIDNKASKNLYGTLFHEFKDDAGVLQSQFYTLFFLRRLLFVTIIFVLIDYPIIQICLCEVLSLSVLYI